MVPSELTVSIVGRIHIDRFAGRGDVTGSHGVGQAESASRRGSTECQEPSISASHQTVIALHELWFSCTTTTATTITTISTYLGSDFTQQGSVAVGATTTEATEDVDKYADYENQSYHTHRADDKR